MSSDTPRWYACGDGPTRPRDTHRGTVGTVHGPRDTHPGDGMTLPSGFGWQRDTRQRLGLTARPNTGTAPYAHPHFRRALARQS